MVLLQGEPPALRLEVRRAEVREERHGELPGVVLVHGLALRRREGGGLRREGVRGVRAQVRARRGTGELRALGRASALAWRQKTPFQAWERTVLTSKPRAVRTPSHMP